MLTRLSGCPLIIIGYVFISNRKLGCVDCYGLQIFSLARLLIDIVVHENICIFLKINVAFYFSAVYICGRNLKRNKSESSFKYVFGVIRGILQIVVIRI